ncbi:Recombination protein O [Legionella massiliensis]|uniref:DNA repair protein RecO n=1 Tax=Legionella massiliensis TaxID=1034943 RepID=A0A078L0I9_9GAMM|nr:DNA repair protein RecO [Legionella massiliensis]CDZ78676.1 Recombination protein O [Legionella massiliensis]CEE14414.1 DNA repair protein RecO [Legionella massiliensis]
MTAEALEAWVLHKTPSGDSSARVTFFTREKGLLNCLCKGGRTPKKQALLQPFAPLWLALDVRRDWHFVRNMEMLVGVPELKGNSLFAGLYVNELLYYALKPMDSQPELYDIYLSTIEGLAAVSERLAIEIVLRRFEWALLETCGYAISFTHTADHSAPILAESYYQFVAGQGFILADTGIPGQDILAIAAGHLRLEVLKSAKFIMRQAIDHFLEGRILKSRSLYPGKGRPMQK